MERPTQERRASDILFVFSQLDEECKKKDRDISPAAQIEFFEDLLRSRDMYAAKSGQLHTGETLRKFFYDLLRRDSSKCLRQNVIQADDAKLQAVDVLFKYGTSILQPDYLDERRSKAAAYQAENQDHKKSARTYDQEHQDNVHSKTAADHCMSSSNSDERTHNEEVVSVSETSDDGDDDYNPANDGIQEITTRHKQNRAAIPSRTTKVPAQSTKKRKQSRPSTEQAVAKIVPESTKRAKWAAEDSSSAEANVVQEADRHISESASATPAMRRPVAIQDIERELTYVQQSVEMTVARFLDAALGRPPRSNDACNIVMNPPEALRHLYTAILPGRDHPSMIKLVHGRGLLDQMSLLQAIISSSLWSDALHEPENSADKSPFRSALGVTASRGASYAMKTLADVLRANGMNIARLRSELDLKIVDTEQYQESFIRPKAEQLAFDLLGNLENHLCGVIISSRQINWREMFRVDLQRTFELALILAAKIRAAQDQHEWFCPSFEEVFSAERMESVTGDKHVTGTVVLTLFPGLKHIPLDDKLYGYKQKTICKAKVTHISVQNEMLTSSKD